MSTDDDFTAVKVWGVLALTGAILGFSLWWSVQIFMRDVCYVTGWLCR